MGRARSGAHRSRGGHPPGIAAVDFLRSPRQVEALVNGALVRWLRGAATASNGRFQGVGFVAGRVLGVLSRITGTRMVADLAEFFTLAHAPLERILVRIESAQRWLQSAQTAL